MRHPVLALCAVFAASAASGAEIGAVQGAAHRSPLEGQRTDVEGVVTLVRGNGFFLQGAGDDDPATSDAIFVFSSATPPVTLGDRVRVEGRVVEFTPPSRPQQLALTEIAEPEIVVLESGAALPAPVLLGPGGRMPPTEVIDDDGLTSFDPETDAIDFYESLEGMRVEVRDAIALDRVNNFGEIWALAEGGLGATGFNGRDAIVLREDDPNPERILLDLELVAVPPNLQAGAPIGTVTGIFDYAFGNFRVQVTQFSTDGVAPGGDHLTVASYNVENLDPVIEDRALVDGDDDVDDDVGDGRFAAIAGQIVTDLGAPAIVALQEVQDNDGAEQTPVVAADDTLQVLADAITAAGGPDYDVLDLPPARDADGGQPGGNIRVAYLYDPSRAELVATSPRRIVDPDTSDGDAFAASRKPLLAAFDTSAGRVTLINVHLSSRGGSDPAFGAVQPPEVASAAEGQAQAEVIGREVDTLLGTDPDAKVIVLGDFNAFQFEPELTGLEEGGRLFNLHHDLPEDARYSYVFEGQAQALDHVLVSATARDGATFEIAHLNAGRLSATSDHDPLLVTLAAGSAPGPGSTPGLPLPPQVLVGEPLRSWLRENWYNGRHAMLGYNGARRAMYARIDAREDGRVHGVYSGFSQPAADVTFLDPINAEHTVPQSWYGSAEPMRSDVHHLFPTHKDVNSARGSKPFGEIVDAETDRWFGTGASGVLDVATAIPSQSPEAYSEDDPGVFEPAEAQKGDTARAVFYFYTMYPGQGRSIAAIAAGGVAELLAWHDADPPDARERQRNDRIEAEQQNRNPFVDHPDLACRAFEQPC